MEEECFKGKLQDWVRIILQNFFHKILLQLHYQLIRSEILDLLCFTEEKLELNQKQFLVFCAFVERFMFEQNRLIWLNKGQKLKFDRFNGEHLFTIQISEN